jgi:hypothetical protein
MTFLALEPEQMKSAMQRDHPNFKQYAEMNRLGELFNTSTSSDTAAMCYNLLGVMTGKARSRTECESLLDGSYSITKDNLLKMLAVMFRCARICTRADSFLQTYCTN